MHIILHMLYWVGQKKFPKIHCISMLTLKVITFLTHPIQISLYSGPMFQKYTEFDSNINFKLFNGPGCPVLYVLYTLYMIICTSCITCVIYRELDTLFLNVHLSKNDVPCLEWLTWFLPSFQDSRLGNRGCYIRLCNNLTMRFFPSSSINVYIYSPSVVRI